MKFNEKSSWLSLVGWITIERVCLPEAAQESDQS
jgi:hypothetical protein